MQVIFKNKIIGIIENDTYISERTREHYFRKFEGWGISAKVIDFLESQKVTTVKIIFENKHELVCPLDFFYIKGIEYKDGDDLQFILPNKFFNQKIVNEVQNVL